MAGRAELDRRRGLCAKWKHYANQRETIANAEIILLKMSFKDLREVLFLSYEENMISDEEFLFLYDEYSSKNPEFEYSHYERFHLHNLEETECKANFRVEKRDLAALAEAL